MNRWQRKAWIAATLAGSFAVASAGSASAQGFEPPGTLLWPLRHQDDINKPRPALGNSFGEFQHYNADPAYLHTGIDIRGVAGDLVVVVASGNVWAQSGFNSDGCTVKGACRIYVLGEDRRYIYYYSHIDLRAEAEEQPSQVREQILNAWTPKTVPVKEELTVNEGTAVSVNQVLTSIDAFNGGTWDHLHFSIVDVTQNFDAIQPLSALSPELGAVSLRDDIRPTVSSVSFRRDGTTAVVEPAGACREVSGALDILAEMKDGFVPLPPQDNKPVTGTVNSTGIYEAKYIVRGDTGSSQENTWYRFDRAPLRCVGSQRGESCSTKLGIWGFIAESVKAEGGALNMGNALAPRLFAEELSDSSFDSTEKYVHVLTNGWGEDASWDTRTLANGMYQVTAMGEDYAGLQASHSRFVFVNNSGTPADPNTVTPDAFLRDRAEDVGGLPSNPAGEPFWDSPDIIVVPQGTPVDVNTPRGEVKVVANNNYDVYLRVHNERCSKVTGIKARIFSANPSMILNEQEFVSVTPAGRFVGEPGSPDGTELAPGEADLLGPFTWTPTAGEAGSNDGHRCMLAMIDAPSDRARLNADGVPNDNNIAQLNLQVDNVAFSIRNPDPKDSDVEAEFDADSFPAEQSDATAELRVQYHPALWDAWRAASSADVSQSGGEIVVRFRARHVRLPKARLPASLVLPASFRLVLPAGTYGLYHTHLSERVDGRVRGGMTFRAFARKPPL